MYNLNSAWLLPMFFEWTRCPLCDMSLILHAPIHKSLAFIIFMSIFYFIALIMVSGSTAYYKSTMA